MLACYKTRGLGGFASFEENIPKSPDIAWFKTKDNN